MGINQSGLNSTWIELKGRQVWRLFSESVRRSVHPRITHWASGGVFRNPVGPLPATVGQPRTLLSALGRLLYYKGSEASSGGQVKYVNQQLGADQIATLVLPSQGLSVESRDHWPGCTGLAHRRG